MALPDTMDRANSPLLEIKTGAQSGTPVLRDTRMPVDAIVDNFAYGLSTVEIAEQFEIPQGSPGAIITYAESQGSAAFCLIRMCRSVCVDFCAHTRYGPTRSRV